MPKGRALKRKEVSSLLTNCQDDPRPLGKRDRAILALLYAGGFRRSELVALNLADYNQTENAIRVRSGKGDKERLVYLAAGIQSPLQEWLTVRGAYAGPLFCPISWKGNLLTGHRLSD